LNPVFFLAELTSRNKESSRVAGNKNTPRVLEGHTCCPGGMRNRRGQHPIGCAQESHSSCPEFGLKLSPGWDPWVTEILLFLVNTPLKYISHVLKTSCHIIRSIPMTHFTTVRMDHRKEVTFQKPSNLHQRLMMHQADTCIQWAFHTFVAIVGFLVKGK
jgi:hypothetical protein